MRKLYFLIFCISVSGAAFSQCKNSISLKKASNESRSGKGGVIEIAVTSADEYTYVLNIEKGTGPEKVEERKGKGNALVHFEGLDLNAIYQVQFEFLSADKKTFCRKLVKSQIFFED